jgi:hypothetical protein
MIALFRHYGPNAREARKPINLGLRPVRCGLFGLRLASWHERNRLQGTCVADLRAAASPCAHEPEAISKKPSPAGLVRLCDAGVSCRYFRLHGLAWLEEASVAENAAEIPTIVDQGEQKYPPSRSFKGEGRRLSPEVARVENHWKSFSR